MADILIIEDDLNLRNQLKLYLESKGNEVIIAEGGVDGIETFNRIRVDIVICDIRLPGISGMEVLRRITSNNPTHPPIILITGHGDKALAIEAIHLGAFDFLEKPFGPENLNQVVLRAYEKKRDDIHFFHASKSRASDNALTTREGEVARLASEGLTNDEIAKKLSIAPETVKFHLKTIFRKMGVENRVRLASKMRA